VECADPVYISEVAVRWDRNLWRFT